MSNARNDWWSNVIRMVANYPARKAEYDELHEQSVGASADGMQHGTGAGRTVETIALQEMAPMKQKEYEAVSRAVRITEMMPTGMERVELIRRMYWKGKKLRIDDVTPGLHISYKTGERWHTSFIRLVGQCVGYEN